MVLVEREAADAWGVDGAVLDGGCGEDLGADGYVDLVGGFGEEVENGEDLQDGGAV